MPLVSRHVREGLGSHVPAAHGQQRLQPRVPLLQVVELFVAAEPRWVGARPLLRRLVIPFEGAQSVARRVDSRKGEYQVGANIRVYVIRRELRALRSILRPVRLKTHTHTQTLAITSSVFAEVHNSCRSTQKSIILLLGM